MSTQEVNNYIDGRMNVYDKYIETVKSTADMYKSGQVEHQSYKPTESEQGQTAFFKPVELPSQTKQVNSGFQSVSEGQGTNVMDKVAERGTIINNPVTRGVSDAVVNFGEGIVKTGEGLGHLIRKGFVDEKAATTWQQDINDIASGGLNTAFSIVAPLITIAASVGTEALASSEKGRKVLGAVGGAIQGASNVISNIVPGLKDFRDALPTDKEKSEFDANVALTIPIIGKYLGKGVGTTVKASGKAATFASEQLIGERATSAIKSAVGLSSKVSQPTVGEIKSVLRNSKNFESILNGDKSANEVLGKIDMKYLKDMSSTDEAFKLASELFSKNKKLIDSSNILVKEKGYKNITSGLIDGSKQSEQILDKLNDVFPGIRDDIYAINLKSKILGPNGNLVLKDIVKAKTGAEVSKLLLSKDPVIIERTKQFLLKKGVKEGSVDNMVKKLQESWIKNKLSPSQSQIILNALNQDFEDRKGPAIYDMHKKLVEKYKQEQSGGQGEDIIY